MFPSPLTGIASVSTDIHRHGPAPGVSRAAGPPLHLTPACRCSTPRPQWPLQPAPAAASRRGQQRPPAPTESALAGQAQAATGCGGLRPPLARPRPPPCSNRPAGQESTCCPRASGCRRQAQAAGGLRGPLTAPDPCCPRQLARPARASYPRLPPTWDRCTSAAATSGSSAYGPCSCWTLLHSAVGRPKPHQQQPGSRPGKQSKLRNAGPTAGGNMTCTGLNAACLAAAGHPHQADTAKTATRKAPPTQPAQLTGRP